MRYILILPLALLLIAGATLAQVERKQTPPRTPPRKKEEIQKPDPMVEAWVVSLAKKIADRNPLIRRSAQSALVTVGKPALPHLERLQSAGDRLVAAEAKNVIARITNTARERSDRERRGRRSSSRNRMQQQLQRMKSVIGELSLAPAARAQVDDAFKSYSDRMREIGRQVMEEELDPAERRGRYRQAYKDLSAALKGAMTEEQYASYLGELKKMRKGHRRPRRADGTH